MATRAPGGRGARPAAGPGQGATARRKADADRSFLWRWRRGLFLSGLVSVALIGGVASVVFNIALPPEEPLLQTSFLCAADVTDACGPDNAIATFSAEEDRINVPLEEVPSVLIEAVLATEDRGYFEHGGIDPVGIARALYQDLRGTSSTRQGGSTITQQYVKNAYLTSERSITRKVKEAVLAVKLERELDKDQILERYLNTIYFGRGAYGVGAASRAYFGKDVRQIGVPEASYLAGLIRSPGPADAQDFPEEASRRRRLVLSAMREEGYIDAAQEAEVRAMGWDYVIPRRDRRKMQVRDEWQGIGAEHFIEAVRIQVAKEYGEDMLYGGGLRIYTTLDRDMQAAAWDAVTSTLDQEDDPAGALVAVDEYGQVKAMMGGRDWEADKVNLAMGRDGGGSGRQAGSAFKPFVLAEAVQQGISLNSKFNSPSKMVFPKANAGEDWTVRNYANTEQGVLDLPDATRVSSNTAYAQLMLEVGPQAVVDLANQLGISAELPAVNSLVLGTGEVSVLDMASAYSTFANRGVHNDPILVTKIEQVDEKGRVRLVAQATSTNEVVLTPEQSDLVTYCLRQVVEGGTGKAANIGKPVAGKTGTTQENRDAWFVGYGPHLTAAVWMGYPGAPGVEPRFMSDVHGRAVTGGSFPAEIWAKFMREVAPKVPEWGSFTTPRSFPGRELNVELQQSTTSTSAAATSSPSTTEAPTTTAAPATTTTTAAPAPPPPPPPSSAPPTTVAPAPAG
ncbi:MAG TPA: transglycosylase domain-containing protein [Acidimicrobiales bacterium]|nr:transglycosylase domain-containing protein [Acidimicrobiales bacterium]